LISLTTNANTARFLNILVGLAQALGGIVCLIISKNIGRKYLMISGKITPIT
jgi:hypothetical protein